jgi:hypothetical protein
MAHRKSPPSPPVTIEIKRDSKTYSGSYRIDGDLITVSYLGRTQTTQLGGSASAPEGLARIMLGELVGKAHR